MLKRIEIWNFEAHEHTIIEDLDEGLNLLCGESNSGKTSIVRALKLAAYNEFDPASVRVGTKKCKVMVESDRGKVTVERGNKVNLWTVEPKGGKKEELRAVGVAIVPQAAEVIGLKMVKLGDVDVPVNIMDQLESHFMLSSVGGDKASGSMRAQIVDEISGLSGIEGVIKDVSLDRHRSGREIKKTEDDMNERIEQLHDEEKIAKDEQILKEAERLEEENKECLETAEHLGELYSECVSEAAVIKDLEAKAAELPDTERAKRESERAEHALTKSVAGQKTYEESQRVAEEVEILETRQAELDKFGDPSTYMGDCTEALGLAKAASELHTEAVKVQREVKTRETWLEGVRDPSEAIQTASKLLDKAKMANDLFAESVIVGGVERGLMDDMEALDKRLVDLEAQKQQLLKEVKVCPLTLGPVSQECMEQAGGKT